ncbi:MAG: arginase family protein, partial [Hymenobacteraceae bacterium]|nr:arginase family protein [Hymenobacteraceae bacterium]
MSTQQNQSSKETKIANFDPNGVGDITGGLFGLPFNIDESEVVLIPVPWEVTVSYSAGTAEGPQAIKDASPLLDLYEPYLKVAWKLGMAREEISEQWSAESDRLRQLTEKYIAYLEEGGSPDNNPFAQLPAEVTAKGKELLEWLKQRASNHLNQGKMVGVVGGDHSTPLGLIHALADKHEEFGI